LTELAAAGHIAGMSFVPSSRWWVVPCAVVVACGGGDEVTGDASSPGVPDAAAAPDAAPAPDAVPYPCELGTSTVEGTGPDGELTGMVAFPIALAGFCVDGVEISIRPSYPEIFEGVRIFADLPVPWSELPEPWAGTLSARVFGEAAEQEATFDLDVTHATRPPPDGGGGEPRFAASGTASGDGWSFSFSVDAPYCFLSDCL